MNDVLCVSRAAREARDHAGLVYGNRTYTFAELSAGAAATRLNARGHGTRDDGALDIDVLDNGAAVLVAERDIDAVLAIYAALESHTPVVLVHPRSTAGERARFLDMARNLAPDRDLAAVLFTSGSSGRPRGVLLDRRAFIASAAASAAHLGWRQGDRWLCCLPLAHIGGLSILTRCLIARQCAVLHEGERFDAGRVADQIARERVTLISLVPTMLDALLGAGWVAPDHVRTVLLGGAAASASLLARAAERGVPLLVTYGMTETCSQVCTQRPGTGAAETGCVGPPLPGVELRVGSGEGIGRIQVRGPMLFRGYLANYLADYLADEPGAAVDAAVDRAGWFDTGDRGWLDQGGSLHVLGRDDDTIITGGENVHPSEIEDALTAHPAISAACVFGVPDPSWGQLVAAAVVCRDGSPALDPGHVADLARFLASRLATYKRPRLLCALSELPLSPSGKVVRDRVAAQAASLLEPLSYPRSFHRGGQEDE
jgi:o-succinylbenzoate---CoA ligase